jgi:hypothetical protein
MDNSDEYNFNNSNFDNQETDIESYIDYEDKIHDIVYNTILQIKSYISDNSLPMFEKFEYADFFNLIEDQINF